MRTKLRKRGHPSSHLRVRCPVELLEEMDLEGQGNRSYGITVMLDRAREAKAALGDDYVEVIVLAHRENITEGEALGRLAKRGIEQVVQDRAGATKKRRAE